jgi:hypothetical protein
MFSKTGSLYIFDYFINVGVVIVDKNSHLSIFSLILAPYHRKR